MPIFDPNKPAASSLICSGRVGNEPRSNRAKADQCSFASLRLRVPAATGRLCVKDQQTSKQQGRCAIDTKPGPPMLPMKTQRRRVAKTQRAAEIQRARPEARCLMRKTFRDLFRR